MVPCSKENAHPGSHLKKTWGLGSWAKKGGIYYTSPTNKVDDVWRGLYIVHTNLGTVFCVGGWACSQTSINFVGLRSRYS